MEKKKFSLKNINEINQHISEALEQWSTIMINADADQWAYYLDYSDKDLLNALFIFNHVWQNRAIKEKHFETVEDAEAKVREFAAAIEKCFGINTVELTKKVVGE